MSKNARTCLVDNIMNAVGESEVSWELPPLSLGIVCGDEGGNGADEDAISQKGHSDEVII